MEVRIQKIIADSGFCSRRKAEELIKQGLVKVNGRLAQTGDKADPKNDTVTVSGEKINANKVSKRYIKLYKPRGYVTTMSDSHAEKLVTDLLDGVEERVYPIGRLDKNSEGLLLLTNDGAFANDIMHPKKHVSKTYRVTVHGKVNDEQLVKMETGVEIGEGVTTRPCAISVLAREENRTVLEFIISEGKNRQLRKMCESQGLTVARLKRTAEGGVKLGMLKPGEYKDLTEEEMRSLRAAVGRSDPPRRRAAKK